MVPMEMIRKHAVVWFVRLSAGAMLLSTSEFLWWGNDPLHYQPLDLGGLLIVYWMLGALLLDLLVRFHVGDFFGVALAGGIYGILNGLIITHGAFLNLPLSLVTRLTGLQAFAGGTALLTMFWVFDRRVIMWRFGAMFGVGVVAGIWIRWFPLMAVPVQPVPDLWTAVILVGGGILSLGVLFFLVGKLNLYSEKDLLLARWEWVPVAGILGAGALLPVVQGQVPFLPAAILVGIGAVLVGLLFIDKFEWNASILIEMMPLRPVDPLVYLVYTGLVVLGVAGGYGLPGGETGSLQGQVLAYVFLGLGFLWVPVVSAWIGIRAYIREYVRRDPEQAEPPPFQQ